MAGDEDIAALVRTLMEVAAQTRRLSREAAPGLTITRELSLAMQIEGIAHQLAALARHGSTPSNEG